MRMTSTDAAPDTAARMSLSSAPAYPPDREAEIALRDGSTVHVRPLRHDDEAAIRKFFEGISEESIAFRFFGIPNIESVTKWSLDVDYGDRYALVVESGEEHAIVAHATYIRENANRAEVAFLVADGWQGKGISTILLAQLAAVAEENGISTFAAEVLPNNHRMIQVFRDSGFPVELRSTPDLIEVELPTSLSDEARARFEERDDRAAIEAVRALLEPRSVAVIGASRRRATIGGEILHNLLVAEFNGPVYAVNDHSDVVQSLPANRTIGDISEPIDLAVIVVPAEAVVEVARECASAHVRTLLVISSGFSETGEEGARRQDDLLRVCRDAGMRLVGPNCLGVLNTASEVRLNATFAPHQAARGRVGFMSQSGGLGIAIIEAAGRLGVGLSSFVSIGNRADLSGTDMLRYWEQDPGTDVVLLYLESFGNPRKFARIAPRFARQKPLLAVKSGRSAAGTRATSSHTGALLSASDVTVDALFEQAGVIRTDTLHDLFAVASLLTTQPVPCGDRVAIITNAGGPGIMCADACQSDGVDVPELPADVQSGLAEFLPADASVHNPIDMIATASAGDYQRTLETLIEAHVCDAILTIFVPSLVTEAGDVAAAIRGVAEAEPGVPIAAVFMTSEGLPPELSSEGKQVPGYEFPEDAARAIALAAKHGRWRTRPEQERWVTTDTRPDEAAAIISQQLASGPGWVELDRVVALLNCYGVPQIETRVVASAAEAVDKLGELGTPVVLKAIARGLVHKTDAGGVRLGLAGPDQVRAAAAEIEGAVMAAGYRLDGFVVQPMAPAGVELIVGVVNDHNFGPVIACGAGGTTAELIKDVSVRITPLSELDASEMIRALQTFPLLNGYRGARRCNIEAIEDVLLRLSVMVEAHPEIVELDFNPLIATPDRAVIVDARVRVETAPARAPVASLRA